MKSSIRAVVSNESAKLKPGESAVYGVSIMDGYHTMTLSVNTFSLPGIPSLGIKDYKETTFTLSDQGTLYGTMGKGNITFTSTSALDGHLTNTGAQTSNGSSYPARIDIH